MNDVVSEALAALANLRAARHRVRAVRAITGRVAGGSRLRRPSGIAKRRIVYPHRRLARIRIDSGLAM